MEADNKTVFGDYCRNVRCPWFVDSDKMCTSPGDIVKQPDGTLQCDYDRGILPGGTNARKPEAGADCGNSPQLAAKCPITHGNIEIAVRDRHCSACGAFVTDDDKFCHGCGARFRESVGK